MLKKTAEEFTKALVEDVKLFVKKAPQSDDITLLILKEIGVLSFKNIMKSCQKTNFSLH
jgi:hypothetical protein